MSTELTERYIYRMEKLLPENKREAVTAEVRGRISQKLANGMSEEQILTQLGNPMAFARQHRKNTKNVISDDLFADYSQIIKIVLPVLVVVSILFSIANGRAAGLPIKDILSKCGTNAFYGMIQGFIWVTLPFTIADTVKVRLEKYFWKPSDLLPIPTAKSESSSRKAAICDITIGVLFLSVYIIFSLQYSHLLAVNSRQLFSRDTLLIFVPVFTGLTAVLIGVNIRQLLRGQWSRVLIAAKFAVMAGYVAAVGYLLSGSI